MISLADYIRECEGGPATAGGIYSTPGNTMGMGNPVMPSDVGDIGSESVPVKKRRKKRKKIILSK